MIKAVNGRITTEGNGGDLIKEYAAISRAMLLSFKEVGASTSDAKRFVLALCEAGLDAPDECFLEPEKKKGKEPEVELNSTIKANIRGSLVALLKEVLSDD